MSAPKDQMTVGKDPTSPVDKGDCAVFKAPDKLSKYVDPSLEGCPPKIDTDAITRAESALEELSTNFDAWIGDHAKQLRKALAEALEAGMRGEAREALFHVAHNLRGDSKTLGYPVVGNVADSLSELLELVPEDVEIPVALIHGHVHAVLAMIREEAGGDDNTTAVALANVLRQATSHWLESKGLDRGPEPVAQAG